MLILFRRSKAKTLLKETSHWCYKLNKFNLVNFAKDRGNCPLLFLKLVCLSANLSKTSLSDEKLTFVDRKLSLPLSDGSEIASISSKLNCSPVVSSMNNLQFFKINIIFRTFRHFNRQPRIWPQSTASDLFARTRSFYRPTFIRPVSTP